MSDLIKQRLEANFDPTDSDRAIGLAWNAIRLMRQAVRAVEDDNNGLRLGRDQKGDMIAAVMETAHRLGLMDAWNRAEEWDELHNALLDRPHTSGAGTTGEGE